MPVVDKTSYYDKDIHAAGMKYSLVEKALLDESLSMKAHLNNRQGVPEQNGEMFGHDRIDD